MFLRFNRRFKDGKEHLYWNIVENKRCAGSKVVQRQVLYLGEINDGQRDAWCQLIEAFDEGSQRHRPQKNRFSRRSPASPRPFAARDRQPALAAISASFPNFCTPLSGHRRGCCQTIAASSRSPIDRNIDYGE